MSQNAVYKNSDINLVRFSKNENLKGFATLKRVETGKKATFEQFSDDASFRSGEKICDFVVEMGGEVIFQGSATVTSVVTHQGIVVYEALLEGDWRSPKYTKEEFLKNASDLLEQHTDSWAREREVEESFRQTVGDMEIYLEGLQSWCQQVETEAIVSLDGEEEQFLQAVSPIVSLEIASHFAEYEKEVARLSPEQRESHRAFLIRSLHRFILQSPFSERCYSKPLGYAGDYGMVELMLGHPHQGRTLFAKLINDAFLRTGPVKAHQNRIDYLVERLTEVVSSRAELGLRTRILNLGCGPADEVRRFIEGSPLSEMADFELLDFSDVTLRYTTGKIAESCERSGREVEVAFIEESIQGFLKKAARGVDFQAESYDFVYCAGLYDYLSQGFCAKLTECFYNLVRPGGEVVVTNVSRSNTIPAVMADFLEWTLVERTEEEMMNLAPAEKSSLLKELKSDETQINLFLELRKSVVRSSDVEDTKEASTTQGAGSRVLGTIRRGRSGCADSQL